MGDFKFIEKTHTYLMDGKRMTGVTTVLGVISKPMLIDWASKMAVESIETAGVVSMDTLMVTGWQKARNEALKAHTKKKEAAGTKGTNTHALVEAYVKDCISNNDGNARYYKTDDIMLNHFVVWSLENKVQFLESEKKIYSKSRFVAGTVDFTCVIDGKRIVGDLKTMKKVWDRVPFFQTAAYMAFLVEMGEQPYDASVIVNINKDTHELTEFYSYDWESDIKSFDAALTLYRALNQPL